MADKKTFTACPQERCDTCTMQVTEGRSPVSLPDGRTPGAGAECRISGTGPSAKNTSLT